MQAHIVLAHPEPSSFNGRLAETSRAALAAAGWSCTLSDLYAMGFDPREGPGHYAARKDPERFHPQGEQRFAAETGALPVEVRDELDRLLASDLLVVHFPLWWFGMPAILKGWMDRVFVYGELYKSDLRYDRGRCRGKRMIACVTTGASAAACAPNGREGDSRLHLWPILYPFRYLGYQVLEPELLHGVGGVTYLEGREGGQSTLDIYQERWRSTLESLGDRPALPYNRDEDFDENTQLLPEAPVYSPFIRHP